MSAARKRLRVVVDTNVFVSGTIIKRGHPFDLLEAWRDGLFALLLSREQRDEVEEVLRRPQFQKYRLAADEINTLLRLLDINSLRPSVRGRLPLRLRDKKDEMLLAAALGGKADYLVSGDDDLLVLRNDPALGSLKIVTAREFLDQAMG